MALLGNLLDTVDGLLDAGTGSPVSTPTLDIGALLETSPSIDLAAGLDGVSASVSAPTLVGLSGEVGQLDTGGLLNGLI